MSAARTVLRVLVPPDRCRRTGPARAGGARRTARAGSAAARRAVTPGSADRESAIGQRLSRSALSKTLLGLLPPGLDHDAFLLATGICMVCLSPWSGLGGGDKFVYLRPRPRCHSRSGLPGILTGELHQAAPVVVLF